MSLLDKAKSHLVKKDNQIISKDVIELAVAWAKNEITYSQCGYALEKKGGNVYSMLAKALAQKIKS